MKGPLTGQKYQQAFK